MPRFNKIEQYTTTVNSFNQSGTVEYETTFSLGRQEWEALADAIEKVIDAEATEGDYSESQVLILDDQEVTVFKDTTYFGEGSPSISIYDGDIMGAYSVNLTLGAAHDLLGAIQTEIL